MTDGEQRNDGDQKCPPRGTGDEAAAPRSEGGRTRTRREVMRAGVKLAFVAPVITTFAARQALAAGSVQSCYPLGHPCGGERLEDCCPGLNCVAMGCQ